MCDCLEIQSELNRKKTLYVDLVSKCHKIQSSFQLQAEEKRKNRREKACAHLRSPYHTLSPSRSPFISARIHFNLSLSCYGAFFVFLLLFCPVSRNGYFILTTLSRCAVVWFCILHNCCLSLGLGLLAFAYAYALQSEFDVLFLSSCCFFLLLLPSWFLFVLCCWFFSFFLSFFSNCFVFRTTRIHITHLYQFFSSLLFNKRNDKYSARVPLKNRFSSLWFCLFSFFLFPSFNLFFPLAHFHMPCMITVVVFSFFIYYDFLNEAFKFFATSWAAYTYGLCAACTVVCIYKCVLWFFFFFLERIYVSWSA